MSKPFKGCIREWTIVKHPFDGKDAIHGLFVSDSLLRDYWITTSEIVVLNKPQQFVETKNSRYRLL